MPLTIKNNNQQQQKQLQVPKPQQMQNPVSSQKSPYQQNVANVQPQQNNSWFKGTYPTTNEILGRVYQIGQKDPNTASQIMAGFSQAQQDSSSPWYNPYTQATNQAVNVLQSYGIDTNNLTDEWFQNNTAWQQSLRYGSTTNTPLAPLKNATPEQIVAFNLYQYQYSEPTTKKAEQEWAALQQELTYKATRKDRNYSDDDIINSIDWNKYQTLKAMNDGKTKGAVTELNRAVNFSDDSMRGVLWAARNGGSSGNIVKDMAMYGLGEGNKWVEDPEMRAKLAWGNPETYSPYQVGMTLDEEVGMYFNVPYIDRQTLNKLRATIDDTDKTSMSMYQKAAKSVENAEKAQEQRDKLYAWIDKNIGNKSEEWLLKNLDVKLGNKDYAMLNAMDESIDNGSDLVQMGTAVDYRKQDVIDYIRRKKAELGGNGTAPDIANGTAGSAKTKEQVQQEAEDIHRRNRIKDQEYTGTEKDAYDSVYGEGAYQRDIAAAESLTSQSQAQKDSDQYVNDTVGGLEGKLSAGESARLDGYSGASDQAQQTVKANKDAMVSGEESPEAIIQKNNEEITKGWIEGTVDIYPRTIKYEQTQANLDFAKKQIEDINAKLGDKVFAGQTQETSFTMEINGDLYRITLSPDLSEIEGIDNVNKADTPVPVYASFGLYDSPEEYDADTQVWDAVEKSGQVEAFREKYAQETEKINVANKLDITDEDRELMKLKRQYEIQVEDNEQYLRDYKDQYDADITVFKRLSERRAAHIQNLKDMGASTTEVETADAALTALTGFTSYEATQWDYYNPSYAYAYKIENGEDRNTVLQQAEAEHEEMLEQIKDVEWLKGYCDRHNIEIGNDVRRNMDRRIAKLQRDTQDYEYFRLQFSDDFDKVAEEQRKIDEKISSEYIASHVMNDTHLPQGTLFYDFNGYDRYLTDDEKNTWYYLKAKDEQNGTNKAEEYAKFMTDDTYGVLMTRAAMGIEEGAKALTGQEGTAGLGFTAGNITAVLLSPYTAVASGIYRAKTLFTGEEINPNSRYLQTTKFRSAVREQSAQEILETFGKPIVDEKTGKVTGYDSNLLSKGVQMFYEMLSNRADSMINAASFGWMFGGIGNNVLRELLSASPMGMSAGMEATARAKERGATDAQASAIGLCTFLAETGTEAISLENMSKAFEIGEITGPGSYKQFLVNWLTKAGISEMVGESTNDIVENLADEWIMGELSEHAETVYQYRLAGMSANEAELAARKDEVKGVLRTALMSYLTPGLDVFQTMRGRMGYFSEATDKLNAENPDNKLTVRQVRKQIIEEERSEARKQREGKQKQNEEAKGPARESGEIDYDALEERYAPEAAAERKAAIAAEEEAKAQAKTAEEEAKVKEGKQNTVDFEILETAKTYDKAGKSAAIAAVLDEGSTQDETDTANAASVRLDKIMGPNADPSSELQDLLLGAKVANGDISTSSIKQGIMYSALGGEQSQSRQVMQSDEYQKATPAVKATMLAEAAQQDAQNPDIMKNVANAVREDRIAKQMGVLMANGAAEKIGQAEVKVDFAKLETQKAQKGLDTQRGIEKTAREKQQSMVAESVQNPNNKQMAQDAENAMRDLIDQAKVTREYEQSVKNAQQREDDAVRNAEKVRQKTLSDIRKQAEQYVAQEDQQRAAVAEQQRVEQEQQAVVAEQQRIAQEEKSNATNADAEAFIEKNLPNGTEEDKQKIREMFKKISTETPAQETRDQNGNLTAEAVLNRGKVLNRISKKFNIRIDEEDTTHNGTVSRQNGYYDVKNNRIVIDRNASLSDAMFFVLGHELTHVAEKSSTYKELANALLKIAYGDGADYESIIKDATAGKPTSKAVADILARKALYDERLAEMHKQDNSINGDPITYEEALQEVVADITGKILNGDENLINQLASKTPGIARRVIESIKNFVKKARGIDGEWKTKAQNAVDLLEKALKDAEKQTEHKTKFSLPETTVIASDDQGDALAEELPGGTVALNTDRKYSLSSFSDEEQKRVRQALLDSGRFSKEQVDKYLTDALGIASIIAADRVRLDFTANPAQRFLKPNNDYYFTLDASTLCAKRLLYQGTFDYVQHALPDEVFTPEDLIELVNIMSEMGYETPCGICYVESRRRWLDTYAQEFLDKIQNDPDGFIEKRFKKASDEEKATLRERFAGEMPSVDDLTTSDGLEKLRNDDPLMHKAFVTAMNAKGTANPKVVQLRTEYSGDIRNLTEKEIQKVKDIGGLRIQSFSDFETPHLLDMVQAVMDMASVGLTSQAYTKVANFAWVFGDTGIKINLSLIGKGTGLDADGNLVFDDVEGMPFEEAMKLRERYSKNVGTILVGINDEHIIAAMADPRIDFIIPFHKSGWSDKELKGIPSLNNYQDYTDSQNEKKIKGRNKTNDGYDTIPGKESKLVNFQPVGKNGYWEFDKSGEWNARKYLQMCAKDGRIPKFSQFLVDNGDGSFSLPEGDDKRSVAIRTGYWKTLIDFKMYDNDGNGAEQTAVTPNINMDQAQRVLNEHKLGRQMPKRKDGSEGIFIPVESNNDVPIAIPAGDEYIRRIKEKRRGIKPTGPNDSLEATPVIEVSKLGKSAFHQNDEMEQGVPNARSAAMASNADLTLGNTETDQEDDYSSRQEEMAIDPETGDAVRKKYSLPVTDKETLDFLDKQEKEGKVIRTYRTMKLLDGKLVSPKATLINGKVEGDTQLGQWEAAAEHPELVKFDKDNGEAYFELKEKGSKSPIKARYNPYMHSSNLMLNDQFKAAYQYSGADKALGKFVTVECIVPESEASSGYHAQYAKDPVGWTNWKAGGVAQKVEQQGGESRKVFLSRWIKPIRIVPDSEVAQHYKKLLDGKNIEVPANVVTPGLLSELEKAGVKIGPPEKQSAKALEKMTGRKYSLPSDAPYLAAVERGEMGEAQRMVDEAAEKAGYIYGKVYHGTPNKEFTEFKDGFVFFTSNKDTADEYQNPGQMWATRYDKGRTIGAYIKLDNPLILDNSYSDYRNEHTPWQEWKPTVYGRVPDNAMNAQEVAERAKELGYDGVIIRNDKDTKWADSDKYLKKRGRGDTVIAFSAEQIKSSDPITYDDQGRVIPLSERFDTGKKDIRYSLPSDDILEDMIKQYLRKGGVLSENEDVANRDAALVKDGVVPLKQMAKMLKTDKGEGTRQWGTGMAQNMDELADQARQFVLDHSAYQRDTNKAQIDRAVAWVKKLPTLGNETIYDKAVSYVTSDAFRRGGARTADGRAKLSVVMGMAVARNDVSAQVLIADMTNKTVTNIGQALQAQKLFKLMTPEGRIGTLQRLLDDQKVALQRRGKNAIAENLKFSDWVIRAAGLAETEADMKQVRDAALNELAQQIPMNWKDRINSFRMLSMLFNPRTHIRNVVGNALFVPAVGMKNKLAAIAEAMTLEKGERTKTLAPILNKSIREFARMDAETMKETLTGEAKFNESGSLVARQQKGLAKLNGNLLELEDWLFLKGHYRRALGGWMQANGYTVEDVTNDHQLLEKGRAYAIEEAQKATYRDFSKTADALNKISKQGGALGFVVDAALPFKKTPINILRRGIEYSPVGIAKGLKSLMFHMNEYTEYQKALEAYEAGETTTAPVMPDKAVSPNQVIDQICSGLSGTAVMALGFLLAGCGAVTCGLDDDEDKFDKAKGEQEYSIKLFGTDVSMTIDWAAPMCMPFFVGAAIREQAEKENLDIEALINAFGGITEPVFNLSMLDGVNTLLKTNSYDKTNPIAQIGSKLALNYAGSFVPSFLGAVARTYDDKQRKAFVPGDQKGVVSNAMYTLEQAQNKVPIWNQQNIAARNIWGEEKTSSFIERLVENFISPGYFNNVEDDPIINEMGRLYDVVTGDNKMIPDEDPDKKITFTKDKVKQEVVLTDKQWDEYKRVRGQTAKQELTELINSESYQNASDSAKLQMMKDVWSHADKVGKNAVVSDIEVDNKPVGQIAKESKISGYESEMIKYLNNGDFEDYDNAAEAIRQEYDDDEEADAEIRQKLMNYYREMYKKAYRAGGLEGQTRMNEIEEALEYTGLVDESDFMRWQNAVDNAADN